MSLYANLNMMEAVLLLKILTILKDMTQTREKRTRTT